MGVSLSTFPIEPGAGGGFALPWRQLALLLAYATLVWFCAALYIRFGGSAGMQFEGWRGVLTYLLTIPVTVLINRRALRLSGLAERQMVLAITVTTATATMLDGLAMRLLPGLYGGDPTTMARGGAWLLWAIGVASVLALLSSVRAEAAR